MYIIEGNIGVGKSTFLQKVGELEPRITCTLEPIDNWADQSYGHSLLDQFYHSPDRWAYTLETLAMICRSRDHITIQERHPHNLIERSIYSGHYCFAINGHEQGYFSELEWDLYKQWVDFLFNEKCRLPHGIIYLRAEPTTCFERAQIRSREDESALTLDYLEKIHRRHDKFLIEKEGVFEGLRNVPVLTLDVNEPFAANNDLMAQHMEKLKAFMSETSTPFASDNQPHPEITKINQINF